IVTPKDQHEAQRQTVIVCTCNETQREKSDEWQYHIDHAQQRVGDTVERLFLLLVKWKDECCRNKRHQREQVAHIETDQPMAREQPEPNRAQQKPQWSVRPTAPVANDAVKFAQAIGTQQDKKAGKNIPAQ